MSAVSYLYKDSVIAFLNTEGIDGPTNVGGTILDNYVLKQAKS